MPKPYTNHTKIRGDEIIRRSYGYIQQNGPASSQDLCALTGCEIQTVGAPKVARFNQYMRDRGLPHLFVVNRRRGGRGSNGGIRVIWSIRERK